MSSRNTADELLDAAQSLVQERGFNAFSYKDLAAAVGIRTASIHYHFPAKAALGEALMQRYLERLEAELSDIARRRRSPKRRLEALIEHYAASETDGNLCLCGSLASDLATLPEAVAGLVQAYLERSQAWVKAEIEAGLRAGDFSARAQAGDLAIFLIAGLQGALVLARGRSGAATIARVKRAFFAALRP